MRKLVHEEVDREIANKSVNIAIKMLKPELDQLMKGLREAVQAPVKAAGKAAVNKIHPTTGKQSVKTLIRQGQGVSSIPLADEGWSSIHSVISEDHFWDVIDQLKDAGAEGILVLEIEKMIL